MLPLALPCSPSTQLSSLLKLVTLAQVCRQSVERSLVAAADDGFVDLHPPRQDVVDGCFRPVLDDHGVLSVELAHPRVLIIVTKLILARLAPSSLEASHFLSSLF